MRAKFGQNFLSDPHWQKKIVSFFHPTNGFGEIGPGQGALTEHLRHRYKNFQVFEIDRTLFERHQGQKEYELISGDFLKWDFCLGGRPVENYSLIGNLPYESGTKILKRVIEHCHQVPHFVFLLQKEVVDRIVAASHSKDFGSLSVLAQGQYDLRSAGLIPPGAFHPAPKVISQILLGHRKKNSSHPNTKEYQDFLKQAFMGKRKTLKNALKMQFSQDRIRVLFDEMSFSAHIRAEEIEVDRWPEIYKVLHE